LKASYYITVNTQCLHYQEGTVLLIHKIAVSCQNYNFPPVQGVSKYSENFISKEGKKFLSISVSKHFALQVQLSYVLTQFRSTSLLAFICGDFKTTMYSASIENEGKIFHFHFYARQPLRERRRVFETVQHS
jgi:hypothetical protein